MRELEEGVLGLWGTGKGQIGFVRLWEKRKSVSASSHPSPSEHTLPCSTRSPTFSPYLACSARSTSLANPAYPPESSGSLGRSRGRRKDLEMVPVPRVPVLAIDTGRSR